MIRLKTSHVPVAADTHEGMSGKNNEDNFRVNAFQVNEFNPTPILLAVLCDGVGGHQAGEIASKIGVETITDIFTAAADAGKIPALLEEAIHSANKKIYAQANESYGHLGMASTAAVACLFGSQLFTATVGDSRIYLIRGGQIQQLSKDHTWIQDALDAGLITEDDVEGHPNAHVIRRYLGAPNPPEVDLRVFFTGSESDMQAEANQGARLLGGDTILLCSDGLSDLVEPEEIRQIVESETLEDAVKALIHLANARGGHDNITIIVFRVPGAPEQLGPLAPPEETPKKKGLFGLFGKRS
ncbi:MAG: serine/threonine-protein phosphatase [Anaerolineaceae bacterium]|nr:serine/threonine-protein phosphatase [Anaerolineaceae bacterium]